jgi:hypothetical protein
MLQRIQTVYLLLVAAAMSVTLFMPLATVWTDSVSLRFDALGMYTATAPAELTYSTWALFVLPVVSVLLALAAVFLYKKRMLQIRLCIFNAVLLVGFYALFAFFLWNLFAQPGFHFRPGFALAMPVVGLILDCLAIRNIGADEMLIRSLNRLR